MHRFMVLACAAASISSTTAWSQTVSGSLQGQVVDSLGVPLEGVQLAISGPARAERGVVTTDPRGRFRFVILPPGEYSLRFTRMGSQPVAVEHVRVELGRTTTLAPVTLVPAAVQLAAVRIVSPRQAIDPAHTDVGGTISASEYAALPGGSDYTSLIAILPHANESYRGDPINVSGATGLENTYVIDGVNVTAPVHAQEGIRLPHKFLQAVEVKMGGYEAQHGSALGAIVNAVTYSGTNEFEVDVFGFGTHGDLASTPKGVAALRETGAYTYDIGIRAGGPIVRDRLWFSAGYNPRLEHARREVGTLGAFDDEKRTQLYALKLTWKASPDAVTELSLFGDPASHSAVAIPPGIVSGLVPLNADPYLTRIRSGGRVVSLRSTAKLRQGTVLEAAVSRGANRDSQNGLTEVGRNESQFLDYQSGTISGGTGLFDVSTGHRSTASLRSTSIVGRHELVAGGSYEDAETSRVLGYAGDRQITRSFTGAFDTYSEASEGEVHNRISTAYVQDSWRVTEHLSVSPGMRWSSQSLYGASGRLAQRFRDQVQPRVSAVLLIGSDGKKRIFGSFGRFYQDMPLNLASILYVDGHATGWAYDRDPRLAGAVGTVVWELPQRESEFVRLSHGRRGENSDEVTLGFEAVVGGLTRLTSRVLRRELRSSYQWGFGPDGLVIGTPGEGDFDFLPRPKRTYRALELAATGQWRRIDYRSSYVWSRSQGNFTGYYQSDFSYANPGGNAGFIAPHHANNSMGLLPNDHPHVFKLAASRTVVSPLTIGTVFSWHSGSPVNEFAPGPGGSGDILRAFVVPRGSAGRSPSLWDLNLRFALHSGHDASNRRRLLLDILHVGNPQRATRLEEHRYLANSGGVYSEENAEYRKPLAFQAPMQARLGAEFGF
jgi:hypothetical protein